MPTYHTGSVRYHVSDFLADRHPYNPNTGFETQRQRENNLVKNSHETVALDKLQEDLISFDDPNEKVKALRSLIAHSAAAETKIVLLRKGIVARLAATLMQSRMRSVEFASSGTMNEPAPAHFSASSPATPHIQQLEAYKSPTLYAAWCTVEQCAAQLLRSLCVIPQGVHCVIEEGGWTALIASVADSANGLREREQARICAATAISLLTSTGAALNWLTTGSIDAPKDMELEGYVPWEAFYTDFAPLFTTNNNTIEAERRRQQPDRAVAGDGASSSSSSSPLLTPFAIGTQRLETIDAREQVITAFFDTVTNALVKDRPSPRLLLGLLDTVANLIKMERCLHLGLIAGILRSLSSYISSTLLADDLWIHGGSGDATKPPVIAGPADVKTATFASATASHKHPGTAPVSAVTSSTSSAHLSPQIDIAGKIFNILWHIGLDSVGKHELLELFQVCFQTGKLLQLLMKETSETQFIHLKSLAAGALGSMALMPDLKKMMTGKKDYPVVIPKTADVEPLNGNKDANGLDRSFLDSLLDLLRQSNEVYKAKFPHSSNSNGATKDQQPRLSIADTALKRDLDAVITNTVATVRLISELPAARQYLHNKVFMTNQPPVDADGPALTVAAASEGKEHDLRRQLFYSTRWEKEFKVYVY